VSRVIVSIAAEALPNLRAIEDAYIDFVLAQCGGNKARAAQMLGIARETLRIRFQARRRDDMPAEPHQIEIVFNA